VSSVDVKKCSMPNCSEIARYGQRYCVECHRKYMKAWRAKRRRREEELKQSVVKLRKQVVELQQRVRELEV
jgi:hypothetical protein